MMIFESTARHGSPSPTERDRFTFLWWVTVALLLGGAPAVLGQTSVWGTSMAQTYCITCQVSVGTSNPPTTPARLYLLNSNQSQIRIESNGAAPTDTGVDFVTPTQRWVLGINVAST